MLTQQSIPIENPSLSMSLHPIRALIRRGAYAEAVSVGESLPVALRCHPARRYGLGRVLFAKLDQEAATPGESVLLALEAAALQSFRYADFATALQSARQTLAKAATLALPSAEQAEAERVYIRIALTAATYYLIDKRQYSPNNQSIVLWCVFTTNSVPS